MDSLTFEISNLEQEIEKLEMEISNKRHSTPNVPQHSNHQPLAGTTPVRPKIFSPLADHDLPSQIPMARQFGRVSHLTGQIPMASQFGRASHLTDHTGNLLQGNMANQGDNVIQRETGWQPRRLQYSPFTSGNGFVDHKRQFIKPSTFDGSTSWTDFKSHFEVCSELNG